MTAETTREELHFRRIDMRGYRRSDGAQRELVRWNWPAYYRRAAE